MRPFLFFLLLLIIVSPVTADEHEDEDETGEDLGIFALFFLGMGSSYIFLRRLFVFSRRWSEERQGIKDHILVAYRSLRKPILLFHNWTMIIGTAIASVHGLLLISNELDDTIFGILSLIAMIVLCLSGIVMYYRYKPIWDNRTGKGLVKFLHRQWILAIMLSVTLILHVAG